MDDPSQDSRKDPSPSADPVTSDDPLAIGYDADEGDDLPDVSYDPPDGGYGWLVVLCGWLNLLLMSGTYSMFGMMYPYLLHTFAVGDAYTVAIITSTFFSMFAICVFAGSLCDMFGCRVVALLGNAIASVGLIIAAFASNFTVLFLSYGVMTGIGYGTVYMANVVLIQHYFTTKRSIALGLTNAGLGIGMFVYPPMTRYFLAVYGWRGTLLMLAAMWLQGLIPCSLLRPLPAPPPPSPLAAAKWKGRSVPSFYSSMPMMAGISSSQLSQLGQSYRSLSIRQYVDKYTTSQQQLGTSYRALNVINENVKESHNSITSPANHIRSSHGSISVLPPPHTSMNSVVPHHIRDSQEIVNSLGLPHLGVSCVSISSFTKHHIGTSHVSISSSIDHPGHSQRTVNSSQQEMTPCSVCTHLATSIWNTLDLKAFANIYVLLFTLIQVCCGAFPMTPVYLPRKCMEAGLSSAQVAVLISTSGLMDTIGRLVFGALGYRFDFTIIYLVCISGTGVCMMSMGFSNNFWFLLLCVAIGYLFYGGYANMLSATIVDFVGVERFARVFGFVLVGTALGFILAGPVVAQIDTGSQSYTSVFVVCGCMQLTGALLCAIVLILRALNCGTIYQQQTYAADV